jgi:hypothetical protein
MPLGCKRFAGERRRDVVDQVYDLTIPDDIAAIPDLDRRRRPSWRRDMKNLVRYRAMESLCRQSAVFRPLESWRLLAEAEMWHHKAQEEIASLSIKPDAVLSVAAAGQRSRPLDGRNVIAG